MHLSRRVALGLGGAYGVTTLVAPATAADFKFNLANVSGANSLPAMADKIFADLVAAKSGGRIEVVSHPGGALGYKERDQYTAVEDGGLEMANTPFDKLVGLAPIFELQSLPFLTPTIAETKAMLDAARPWYEAAFNQANQTLLFGAPYTPQGIWARKLIRTPADLKGMKMRTYDVTGTKTFLAAGAQPVQLSWADVPSGLSTNVIEAVLTSDESGVSARFWDLGVKYFNFLGYTMGIGAVTMNMKKFTLPPRQPAGGDPRLRGRGREEGVGDGQRARRPEQEDDGGQRRGVRRGRAGRGHQPSQDRRRAAVRRVEGEAGTGRRQDHGRLQVEGPQLTPARRGRVAGRDPPARRLADQSTAPANQLPPR